MSKYYTINGLKVRVSDHEPNHSMNKFRGTNDVELYTKSIEGRTLSILAQVESYCDDNDLDIALFSNVLSDFPEVEVVSVVIDKIEVSQEFIHGYQSIQGKGAMRRKAKYCQINNICSFKMSQGYYTIK